MFEFVAFYVVIGMCMWGAGRVNGEAFFECFIFGFLWPITILVAIFSHLLDSMSKFKEH